MTRDRQVQYEQDDLGHERKKLDPVRSKRTTGFVNVTTTGSDVLLEELPDDVAEYYITQIHVFDTSSTATTFSVVEAETDGAGTLTGTSQQATPTFTVSADSDRVIDYDSGALGDTYDPEAIAVNTDGAVEIAVTYISDHPEHEESASGNAA